MEGLLHRHLVVLEHHLCSSSDALVQLCHPLDSLLPARSSVMARADAYCVTLSLLVPVGETGLVLILRRS